MLARPEIFISATSGDLNSCRQLVRDAVLTLGCVPVVQNHFPPSAGTVRTMLREKIASCDAVILLVGECYGSEPQERAPTEPRRSYTQIEYDIARELKKPLYTFLCTPNFPYDGHEPEPVDRRVLQDAHRAALAAGDNLYLPVHDPRELSKRVCELQARVDSLTRDLRKTRNWLSRGAAAAAVALTLIVGLLYGVKRQVEQAQARAEEREHRVEGIFTDIRNRLPQTGKDSALVARNIKSDVPAKSDPAAAARRETAQQLGISVEELQRQLTAENSDLRALVARIEQESAAAEAKAAEWRKLKRDALTKLGDAEKATGHYAASLEPYRQALALTDKNREPLSWCDAARDLENGLWQMGRYPEAEPLARELVDMRTALEGAENPDTLKSINRLANLLYSKGDYAGAETLFRRCLEARERTLGKDHIDTLRSAHNLAGILEDQRDLAGAETLFRRCLEGYERISGKESVDTLRSVRGLANVLEAKHDLAGAESLYRRCLEVYERVLGKEHPDTLGCVDNLAGVLDDEGNHTEAETLYRRALEVQERTLGRLHPDTALTSFNFSVVEKKQNKLYEALPLAEEAVAAAKVSLPNDHPLRRRYEENLRDICARLAVAIPLS